MNDEDYMQQALQLAQQAERVGEVPVGALVVLDNTVIGAGWNQPIGQCDPTAHAEIVALRQAACGTQNYRLPSTTLYVTLEPCAMCVGAMVHARVARLVFGTDEPRSGAVSSTFSLLESGQHNHTIEVLGGVLAEQCASIMRGFFAKRR